MRSAWRSVLAHATAPSSHFVVTDLLRSPIVLSRSPWDEWQSRLLRQRSLKQIVNYTDPFDAIMTEHFAPLLGFALSLTRSESDACDLTQQTFYIWTTKGRQLRDFSMVKGWPFTTLHRVLLGARRQQVRFPHSDLEEAEAPLPSVVPGRFSAEDTFT